MVKRCDIRPWDQHSVDIDDNPEGDWVSSEDYDALKDTLTFILTCDRDQLLTEGMDRVRAALKLADGA